MAVDERYKEFIRESLVKPIRSVLIVDDDYPTIDELLIAAIAKKRDQESAAVDDVVEAKALVSVEAGESHAPATKAIEEATNGTGDSVPALLAGRATASRPPRRAKEWETAPEKVKAVFDHFRGLLLLVDVHDGSDIEAGTAQLVDRHLHQSDLLILDYHLDETDTGDKAIEIARAVASNDHFNMVVVNTRHELPEVFEDMLLGLLAPLPCFEDERYTAGETAVEAREGDHPGTAANIKAAIGTKQFLDAYEAGPKGLRSALEGKGVFGDFKAALDGVDMPAKDRRDVLIWALGEFQITNRPKLAPADLGAIEWSAAEPFWIRSDRLFMAFSNKRKTTEPLDVLLEALCAWSPPPSRLILGKFRAEMEAKGVAGESKVVADKLATAHWYLMLLRADDAERRTLIEDSIGRHAEQMVDDIARNVHAFADSLSAADREVGAADYIKRVAARFESGVESIDTLAASFAANAMACSKSPRGWHLRTGHVFEMSGSFWVCLTPICDMVPGQKRAGHRGEVGTRKPFIAVKLHPIKAANYKDVDVNSNNFLFLKVSGQVKAFSLLENGGSEEQPHWYMLYAEDNGKIDEGQPFPLSKLRDQDGNLVVEQLQANLVGELRYEYAINLMQKLGGSLTRVGLDFTV